MEAAVNGNGGGEGSRADIWRDRIAAQRAGGQSVRAWCQANNAREHSFYWWRARLGLSPARRPPRPSSKPIAFARVVVHPSAVEGLPSTVEPPVAGTVEPLRLRFGGQAQGEARVRELILPASMPIEQVARLVRAIEGMA